MTATNPPPRLGDMVHYVPMVGEISGCRAAIVTEIHVDPLLVNLMVLHSTAVQFLPEIRQAETEFSWDTHEPGTWHIAAH